MENHIQNHLQNMFKVCIPFLFVTLTGFGQSNDSLIIKINDNCEKNFSPIKIDSSYCNFYIKDFKDTIYFRHSNCINEAQTTSPLTFKRRIQNGYADGFIRIYSQSNDSYTWIDGKYSEGFILTGSYLEYYSKGTLKLTGQFENGHRSGVWTWYFENGKINRIIIFEIAEPIREVEYDIEGNVVADYDLIKEKTNANTTYKR